MKASLSIIYLVWITLNPLSSFSQTDTIDYLGQSLPGKTITPFAPVPGTQFSFISFSPSVSDVLCSYSTGNDIFTIKYSERTDEEWLPFSYFKENQEFISVYAPFEGVLYFWGYGPSVHFSEKKDTGWSELIETNITGATFITATLDSNIFFKYQGNGVNEFYYSKFNGVTQEDPKPLPYPINYNNPEFTLHDPCVSPDGSYIIFGNGGTWGNGLYVSFKKENDQWTFPKRLISSFGESSQYISNPDKIRYFELNLLITPDGKYIISSGYYLNNQIGNFWVSTEVIEDARNSNFAPYVNKYKLITDTVAYVGEEFSFALNDSTFIDDDGNETLTITATLSNGNNLPDSLFFNSETNTFSGSLNKVASFNIKVIATDTEGERVSDIFRLRVKDNPHVGIKETSTDANFIIYPNPAHDKILIESATYDISDSYYKIFSIAGTHLLEGYLSSNSIDISELKTGTYLIQLKTNTELFTKKIVIK